MSAKENTTKFNKDNNNYNERTTNTLNQQQDAINKTLDSILNNVKRTTDEATREIPRYTQRIAEYQEQTIQTVRDIASDYIEAQKQVIGSFQSQVDRNNNGAWDLYNPQKIAENHAVMVNNFTSYLLNTSNLINNALASNMRVYNTALEQTRDNVKACAKTNTQFIQSVNSQNKEVNFTRSLTTPPYSQILKTVSERLTYSNDLIDINQSTENQKKKDKKPKRILIAEPDSDIHVLYSLFTKQYGFSISDVKVVQNGNKCLEIIHSNRNDNNENNKENNDYDIFIVDTHLSDISGFEVARKIRNRLPHKRIILTTTYSLDNISSMIDSIGIKSQDVLFKPFSYYDLVSILKEPGMSNN